MKIFITGGTGFVGAHFLSAAMKAGHELIALRRTAMQKSGRPLPEAANLTWLTKSLSEVTAVDLAGCETLVHLAAHGVSPQPATWEHCFQANLHDTLSLVREAANAEVKRIVVGGSYAEYGRAGLRFEAIPPDAPLEPADPYTASKAASGIALAALSREQMLEFIYFRISSVFGEGQYERNFWPQLCRAARAGEDFSMTEGNQIRDYIAVEEVAKIILRACSRHDLQAGDPVIANLGSGKPVSLRDFAQAWWSRLGATGQLKVGAVPLRQNEVQRFVPLVTSAMLGE